VGQVFSSTRKCITVLDRYTFLLMIHYFFLCNKMYSRYICSCFILLFSIIWVTNVYVVWRENAGVYSTKKPRFTKRCCFSWLTIAPSYKSLNGGGGGCGVSAYEYSCAHGAQINSIYTIESIVGLVMYVK
jgi:hypothetical protein